VTGGMANYKNIDNIETAQAVLDALRGMKENA